MTLLEVKSKFNAEYRRFAIDPHSIKTYELLYKLLETTHGLFNVKFIIQYLDAKDNTLLPINNDRNCERAFSVAKNPFRILIQLKGESYGELKGYNAQGPVFLRKKPADLVRSIGSEKLKPGQQCITILDDFHKVSSIIDDGTVPECMRRVHLIRTGSKPLGFYIRDGFSIKTTPSGVQHVPGVFISRLLPGGLADSTGLLAVKDEIIEVNGIEVYGKSLDQVTDMMIANSSNLIITVKPINQKTCVRKCPSVPPPLNPRTATSHSRIPSIKSPTDSLLTRNSGSIHSYTAHSNKTSQNYQLDKSSNSHITEIPGVIDI